MIVGRTNTPAFSYRWFTSNRLHGAPAIRRNPALTPGGSSGGAAAAVAAGIGHIAHGTDIAGSIRYPAYACGVHGLRPTLGRVAAYNASSPERTIGPQLMAVSGPIARPSATCGWRWPRWPRPTRATRGGCRRRCRGRPRRARRAVPAPRRPGTRPEVVAALLDAARRLARRLGGRRTRRRRRCKAAAATVAVDGRRLRCPARSGRARRRPRRAHRAARQAAIAGGVSTAERCRPCWCGARRWCAQWRCSSSATPWCCCRLSAELPFPAELDLGTTPAYARVWRAQMTEIGAALHRPARADGVDRPGRAANAGRRAARGRALSRRPVPGRRRGDRGARRAVAAIDPAG